jgi:hypothetical protein
MALVRTALTHAAVLSLTGVHHWYGAVRFDTPWRTHVVHVAVWLGVAIGLLLGAAWLTRGRHLERWVTLALVILSVLSCVAWLGLYEGGYNHVLKNVLYFGGLSAEAFRQAFPPPTYGPPEDWIFELTGVAQLPLGLLAGWAGVSLRRHTRRSSAASK